MALQVERVTPDHDTALDAFCCWDGDEATPWIEEAENFVRMSMRRTVGVALAFRDGGDIVGVSAFDRRYVQLPFDQTLHPAWQLQVVAVALERQNGRMFSEILHGTFASMRQTDPGRVLLIAHVHHENQASLRACARHDIDPYGWLDNHYRVLLGEVPPG